MIAIQFIVNGKCMKNMEDFQPIIFCDRNDILLKEDFFAKLIKKCDGL